MNHGSSTGLVLEIATATSCNCLSINPDLDGDRSWVRRISCSRGQALDVTFSSEELDDFTYLSANNHVVSSRVLGVEVGTSYMKFSPSIN